MPNKQTKKPAKKVSQKRRTVNSIRNVNYTFKLAIHPGVNHHKSHKIRRKWIVALVVLLVVSQIFFFTAENGRILGENPDVTIAQLLNDTNSHRTENSLKPLALNPKLMIAAEEKAKDIIKVGYWAHTSPDGTTPWQRIDNTGYKYSYAGENLARGFNTSIGILEAWMESSTHRANVLGKQYTDVGFAAVSGVLDNEQTTVVVALYGRPIGAPNTGQDSNQAQRITGLVEKEIDDPITKTKLWRGLESCDPIMIASLALLILATYLSLLIPPYRKNTKVNTKSFWYKYHKPIKIGLAIIVAIIILMFYGDGSI